MKRKNKGEKIRAIEFLYNKSPKYFKKIFLIYFILLAGIFLAASYTIMISSNADESYENFANKTTQLEKFKRDTDIVFDTTDMISELISEYAQTNDYAHEQIGEYGKMDFQRLYELSKTMKRIQTDFAGYNLNIAMTRLDDDIVITGGGETESIEGYAKSNSIDIEKAARELDVSGGKSYIVPSNSLDDKVAVVYKRDFSGANSVYYIMFFNNDNINYICTGDVKYIFSDYNEEYAEAVISGKYKVRESGEISYIDGKRGSSCFFTPSDRQENIIYVKCFPSEKKSDIPFAVLLSVILVGAAAAFAVNLAKYTYYPLRSIFKKLGMSSGSGIDELEALGDRIDYIMENNSNMRKSIKNKFLFDVLNGFIWGEALREGAAEHGYEFLTGDCLIAVMDTGAEDSAEVSVCDSLCECFEEYEGAAVCSVSKSRCVAIFDRKTTDKERVLEDIDYVRRTLSVSICAAVAENSDGRKISDIYRFLSLGLDNKSLTNKKDIITESDIAALGREKLVYPSETEAMLVDCCANGEGTKALYCLKNIFLSSVGEHGENLEVFKYAMIVSVKRILAKLDAAEEDIFGAGFDSMREISAAKSADEAFSVIKQIIEMIIDFAEKNITSNSSGLASDIIRFINDNLQKDVSVGDVSDRFSISPSYIARLLRSNYNTSFKAYLNDARIKKAKQMMDENKNILIKDLAASLGYNNSVSFIRMFKKNEGISPGEYLKMK